MNGIVPNTSSPGAYSR